MDEGKTHYYGDTCEGGHMQAFFEAVDLEKWLKELTAVRDGLENHYDSKTQVVVNAGKLTNVILEMTEDYYGEPRNGVYDGE